MKKLALLLALCLFVQCIGLTTVALSDEVEIPVVEESAPVAEEEAPAADLSAEEAAPAPVEDEAPAPVEEEAAPASAEESAPAPIEEAPAPVADEAAPAAEDAAAPVPAESAEAEASIGDAASTMALPEGMTAEEATDVLGVGEFDFLEDVLGTGPASTDFEIADINNTGNYVIIQYNGTNTVVNIPSTVIDRNGNPQIVTGIQRAAFRGNTKITQVNLPTTVTWVDEEAFKGCTALQSIDLPNQITRIRNSSFSGCTSLTAVSWTDQVTVIESKAFEGCTSLTTLGTSTNVTTIGDEAFKGCTNLKAVTWSDNLTQIGNNCYENCTSLTALLFPASLQTVGIEAFKGCTSIQKMEFQTNTTMQTIGNGAFQNCIALKEIYIPDSVTRIGDSAFENCSSATILSLPASITTIEDFTFKNCSSVKFLSIPVGVTDIHQEAFYGCSSVEWVYTIPATVTFIGDKAFDGLSNGCWIVVENARAKITTDGLGTTSNLFGWSGSTAQTYASNHANVHFYNIQIVNYVRRCYNLILNRAGDGAGVIDWSKKLAQKSETGVTIVHNFMFSSEFSRRGLNNTQAVEILYNTMLNRQSDPAGIALWVGFLDVGCSYDYVIKGFCGAPEFIGLCSNTYSIDPGKMSLSQNRDQNPSVTAFVQRCFRLILTRNPDVSGLNTWTGELNSKRMSGGQVVAGFVASPEFRGRNLSNSDQVEVVYQTMLSRASDPDGKALWLSYMAQNMTVEYVVNGFSGSLEFRFLCQGYGINAGPVITSEYRDRNAAVTMFANRIYQYALNRTPDIPSLNALTGSMITKSTTPAAMAKAAFTSLECQMRALTNGAFVDAVYRGYLNRAPSNAELSEWTARLNMGTTRETFCNAIGATPEFAAIVKSFGL